MTTTDKITIAPLPTRRTPKVMPAASNGITMVDVPGAGPHQPELSADVNLADAMTLQQILGVTQEAAEAIVKDRMRIGPFITARDLARVPGLADSEVARLQTRVVTLHCDQPHITALEVAGDGHIRADEPFELVIEIHGPADANVVLLEALVRSAERAHSVRFDLDVPAGACRRMTLAFPKVAALSAGEGSMQLNAYSRNGSVTGALLKSYALPKVLSLTLTPKNSGQGPWPSFEQTLQVVAAPTLGAPENRAVQQAVSFEVVYTVANLTGASVSYTQQVWTMSVAGVPLDVVSQPISVVVPPLSTLKLTKEITLHETSGALKSLNKGETVRLALQLNGGTSVGAPLAALTASLSLRTAHYHFAVNLLTACQLPYDESRRLGYAVDYASLIYLGADIRCRSFSLMQLSYEGSMLVECSFVGSEEEALELFQSADGPEDGPDVFLVADAFIEVTVAGVQQCQSVMGFAVPSLTCEPGKDDGILLAKQYDGDGNLDQWNIGQTLAHELGHYVGLEHPFPSVYQALMNQQFNVNQNRFLMDEADVAQRHCAVRPGPGAP